MDPIQITIILISFFLTVLIIVLGIQVFYILKEMRVALQKGNKMLDDLGKVTGTVGQTAEGMGNMVNGLKAGLSFISTIRNQQKEGHKED